MKKILFLLLILAICSFANRIIAKDSTPGGIYIVGPDVSPDSTDLTLLYYSPDAGSTLVIRDTLDWLYFPLNGSAADVTDGIVYLATTGSYEGVILPSYDQWVVGHKWDTKYKVKATLTVESEEMAFDGDIIIANEIVSIEPVTVTSGTYTDAIKINSKKTINQETKIEGSSMSFSAVSDISSWYVEGIGLVKKVSKSECGTTLVELLSVE